MRWVKRLVPWVLAVGIGAALVWAFLPKPLTVDLAPAVRGPFEVVVRESGRTRVRHRFAVAASVGGTLARIALRPGDSVERGEVVARIRPLDPPLLDARTRQQALSRVQAAVAARQQAEQQLARATALHSFSRVEAERQRVLARAGTVPVRDADAADVEEKSREAELAAASWGLNAATAQLEEARAALARIAAPSGRARADDVEVRAPGAGFVLRVVQESEGPVAAGAPLLELGDVADLEVAVDLLTADAVRVVPGAPAILDGWGGERGVRARVRRVEPSGFTRISALGVEEQRVTVVLDPAETVPRLGDGFRVEVVITVFTAADVLQIPASAVFRSDGEWAVFAVDGARVRLRPLRIGQRNPDRVQVLSGLDAGDRVLLHPSDRVREGIRFVERTAVPGA